MIAEQLRLESDADFGGAPWHGDGGPLPIRRYRDDELTDVAQAGLEAFEEAGCARLPDANAPGAVGVATLPVNTWPVEPSMVMTSPFFSVTPPACMVLAA